MYYYIRILLLLNYMVVSVFTQHEEKAYCPKIQNCKWVYPYYLTKNLKCTHNEQCPIGFLCCSDCHYQHKVCKTAIWLAKTKIKVECPKSTIYCKNKFPYLGTHKYKCDLNNDCDYEMLCCNDDCYTHKICKKAVSAQENEDGCPKDVNFCSFSLPYEETKKYKCISSRECRENYVCCPDSCYSHNICKLKSKEQNRLCPLSIRKEYCTNTNRTLIRYSCKNDNDCHLGYLCCEDNCYDHKVCKLSSEGFSYKSVYVHSELKPKLNFENQHKCPDVEQKCSKPYSLRLAKKFICFKDNDCKIGQSCCKDACVKNFKICKNIFNISTIQIESEENKEFYFVEKDQFELKQNENQEGSGSGYAINSDGEDD